MKARIVFVAVCVQDRGVEGEIEDALNAVLRPARLDSRNSLILDYGFNSDGNWPALPAPIECELPEKYREGTPEGTFEKFI